MAITTIQLTTETRDRLFKLKFRNTYDKFVNQLLDMYLDTNEELVE